MDMLKIKLLNIFLLFFFISTAQAATVTYTSQTSFLNNLTGTSQTIDFDSQSSGTVISSGSSVDGATFSYAITGGASIMIDDAFGTTSPNNYLGLDDETGAFVGGDSFTISFAEAQTAVGLYVISADLIFPSDFTLTTDTGLSVSNGDISDMFVGDGDAYFLGLIESDLGLAFNSITLSSFAEDFSFNVDDITVSAVPLPGAFWLFGFGLLGLYRLGSKAK